MNAASPARLIRCSIVTGITSRARGVCPVFATEQHQPPSLPEACYVNGAVWTVDLEDAPRFSVAVKRSGFAALRGMKASDAIGRPFHK
jgi:hypothetical protein